MAGSEFLETALAVIEAAIQGADPERLVHDHVTLDKDVLTIMGERIPLDASEKIHVLGVGKASPFLFQGIDTILGEHISGGVVISLEAHRFDHDRVEFVSGSHPIPDISSVRAAEKMLKYIHDHVRAKDLVIFLITGGASSLMELPIAGLTIDDIIRWSRLMHGSGLDIHALNAKRKELSAIKGGKLAEVIHPASIVTLAISDVPGSELGSIGSGPTVPSENCTGPDSFAGDRWYILGDITNALYGAKERAEGLGMEAVIWSENDSGDVRDVVKELATRL